MALVDLKFLGWDTPPITSAAEWLLDNLGPDMSTRVVALPGSRAVRSLRLALLRGAQKRGATLLAPNIVTVGALTDLLVGGEGRVASGLVRRLCWERALDQATEQDRGCLAIHDAVQSRSSLAVQVRGLHADLVAAGMDVDQVLKTECIQMRAHEAVRWRAVGRLQQAYRKILASLDLVDPHDRRRLALAQQPSADLDVILVGIASQEPLRNAALVQCKGLVQHLVFAPESLRDLFDAQGCVLTDAWLQREHIVPGEKWSVVSDPKAQAERAMEIVAQSGVTQDSEVSIGIGDSEAVPELIAALAEDGIEARDAAGQSAARSMEGSLIKLLAAFFKERDTRSLADLWRHPWMERSLEGEGSAFGGLLADLDSYLSNHLPHKIGVSWLTDGHSSRVARNHRLQEALARTDELLLPLANAQGADAVCAALREVLGTLLGEQEFDQEDPAQRAQVMSLRQLGTTLRDLEDLPAELSPGNSTHEVLQRVSDELSECMIAPAPLDASTPAVDLLGWLELLFDPAPLLVVTSVVEGAIPASSSPDSILPEALRRELGFENQEDRLARDLFTAEVLDHSRETHWITPRVAAQGDPFLPSRLMLRVSPSALPAQVRRWNEGGKITPTMGLVPPPPSACQRLGSASHPEVFSVTGFKTWLDAPYLYHLQRELDLHQLSDRNRELTPSAFGSLVHKALEVLGSDELRACADTKKICGALHGALADAARLSFGSDALPAVQLQIEQAAHRLENFAGIHAARVQAGWRVEQVEWAPKDGRSVPIAAPDGPALLRGRIDRIERNQDGRWALLDYKTGNSKKSPNGAHRAKNDGEIAGPWRDLQLPLYAHLARELIGGDVPELGYLWLGKDASETGPMLLKCDEVYLAEAYEKAGEIIREIRSGELPPPRDNYKPYSHMESFLIGQGLALTEDGE